MATRRIKRLSDSAEIHIRQPGDKVCPVIGTGDSVLMIDGKEPLDGLFADAYKALVMLRLGQAVVVEED